MPGILLILALITFGAIIAAHFAKNKFRANLIVFALAFIIASGYAITGFIPGLIFYAILTLWYLFITYAHWKSPSETPATPTPEKK